MEKYLEGIKRCVKQCKEFEIYQISREENKLENSIAKTALEPKALLLPRVQLRMLDALGTCREIEVTHCVSVEICWMTPIMEYLSTGKVLMDRNKAIKLRRKPS